MPDNIPVDPTSTGTPQNVATDDIGGRHYQLVKMGYGGDGVITFVDAVNGLPIRLTNGVGYYDARDIRALTAGDVVTANQGGAWAVTVSNTVAVTGNVNANTGLTQPLTDTQLRATPVPVSVASLPLPAGAATDRPSAASPAAARLSNGASFYDAREIRALTSADAVTVANTVAVSFSWAGLTDAQLRATPVAISAAALPLPAGAATAVAQASATVGQVGTLMQAAVTTGPPAYTTGQTSPLSLDVSGGLRIATHPVTQSGTWNVTVNAAIAAGANAIGDVGVQYRANATGAASTLKVIAAASVNAAVVKASAGRLLGWQLQNTTAAIVYVKLHNVTTAPVAGTTPVLLTIAIPANGKTEISIEGGIAFATGIGITIVTGAADADATAVTVNAVIGSLHFA